jgi:cell wall-associated NlpC family hydrolase
MRKGFRFMLAMLLAIVLTSQTACTSNRNNAGNKAIQNDGGGNGFRSLGFSESDARIPLKNEGGKLYVPLEEITRVIGYQTKWSAEGQTLEIGDIDPFYKLSVNSLAAEKEEEQALLSEKPVMLNGKLHIPVTVLSDLFQQDLHYKVEGEQLVVHAVTAEDLSIDQMENAQGSLSQDGPFFQDDPEDPFKGDIPDVGVDHSAWNPTSNEDAIPAALPTIDINALIQTAMKYRGVPYEFGAAPYPQSKRFDCSSYTQYVFAKYGVKLQRISRNQAKQGIFVSRNSLRKGDLVFFSVPGRFKSDKTVGHVGIYIGNGKMINTYSNKNGGVHIANVNTGYWSTKYITARRVAY